MGKKVEIGKLVGLSRCLVGCLVSRVSAARCLKVAWTAAKQSGNE